MRLPALCFVMFALLASQGASQSPATPQCEPWEAEYTGRDSSGPHVVACWQFTAGRELEDSSGHGHTLSVQGAKASPKGRFGGGLESFPGWPVADQRHAAVAKSHPSLSPQGAFTLDLWIQPAAALDADYPQAFLLDKKYVAHDDCQLILAAADKRGERVVQANLGFGEESSTYHSRPAKFEPGTWHHVAFTYDGAGTGSFFLDGRPWGSSRVPGRGSVSPGKHPLSIGDRVGSYHHGFPGLIDQVRICRGALEFRAVRMTLTSDRACFVRMEPGALLRWEVQNLQREPIAEAALSVSMGGLAEKRFKLPPLAPGATCAIAYPVDTGVRPDAYEVTARLSATGRRPREIEEGFPVRIVPRRPPRFPVVMWGVGSPDGVRRETERLKRIGFTHVLGLRADYGRIWSAGQPTEADRPEDVADARAMLDEALANGLSIAASLSPASSREGESKLLRIDRKGNVQKQGGVCALSPELQTSCFNVGASMARSYGAWPAFSAALAHTEVRDHANPCFHGHDLEAFRKAAGSDVPAEVAGRSGVDGRKLPGFPASRVIADDHPLYVYYRWYWKSGDGWNGLNTALTRGLKSTGRGDLWTWHDPAVRVASVYGSGGEVDAISQWTYSYPDPIRIAVATDELLAMAGGAAQKQQVMKMTQIIWYRSQTAPEAKAGKPGPGFRARWEIEQPDAPFITIAPMHLREAFWTKIARPIRGIMYHGWQSLVPCDYPGGYRFTHPATQHELARLVQSVVEPLGPALLAVPGAKSDVAFLESFASQMFARRGTYGWGGHWLGDAYHVMLYAHLQPEIVFDETIVARGLEGFRVLVMCDCDVVTASMLERIKAFQARGGIVVGDDRLCAAIKPDVLLKPYERTGRADQDKAALLALAAELRKQLDGRYRRYVDASHAEVIPYRRRLGEADYVFVVNDRREYGQYVGHHGLVMENGLPADATLSIAREGGAVYDLVRHRPMAARQDAKGLRVDLQLGPCDGGVYLVVPKPIEQVKVEAPETAERGKQVVARLAVVDSEGQPIKALVPVEVTVRDAETRMAEGSGFYAAVDGMLSIPLDVAVNDPPGIWQIEVRELASGTSAVGRVRVRGPEPWPPARQDRPQERTSPVQPKG